MKIKFVNGWSSDKWNIRRVWWNGRAYSTRGTFIPANNTDIELKEHETVKTKHDENHIIIVKQPTLCRTAFILFHELCHWLVHKLFRHHYLKRTVWHRRIDKYL